jgi:hypothetical protein
MRKAFAALAVLASVPVFAQAKGDSSVQEADKTVFRKKTVIDFTDVAVEGELTKPEGTYTLSKKQTRFKSLIKVRENFRQELRDSKDNL